MTAAFWGLFALLTAVLAVLALAVRTGYGKFTRPPKRPSNGGSS